MGDPDANSSRSDPATPGFLAFALLCLAVLLSTSPWFSGTAAIATLKGEWGLSPASTAWLTAATQLGFIGGTALFAATNLADVFDARWVYALSSGTAAAMNAGFAFIADGLPEAIAFRALTGVALAGVYPVGMKICAAWFPGGLGWRLGVVVGALCLGTASPYFAGIAGGEFSWRWVAGSSTGAAVLGAALVLTALPPAPLRARPVASFDPGAMWRCFKDVRFRDVAFAYFGHMWELYAFWASAASFLMAAFVAREETRWAEVVPLLAFFTIGMGAFGCVAGGALAARFGGAKVALVAIAGSGLCAAASSVAFTLPPTALVIYMGLWGALVVADSPQLSALAARHAPPNYVGTALTVQNSIGFAVTIGSIQLLPILADEVGWQWTMTVLAIGPAVGVLHLRREVMRPL